MAERLHQDDFESKAFPEGKLSLIDFYSDSCVPCKRMSPVLAELEEEFSEQLFVGKVNIAYDTELTKQYEITAAPTLLFFKNKELVNRLTGAVKKADLEAIIKENI